MKSTDTLGLETAAAEIELATLSSMKEGDVRRFPFLPSIDIKLEWILTIATEKTWMFSGMFAGMHILNLRVWKSDTTLEMEVVSV